MQIIVLGSAAGGGFPQWNCACPTCRLAWQGSPKVRRRTQSSLAVTADGERFLLLNASPDLRQQVLDTPALHPRNGARHSPIEAVAVTNGDVDHVAGLLTLRERQPFVLYGTATTLAGLAGDAIFRVLASDVVERRAFALEQSVDTGLGLVLTPFAVPGKVPLYREAGDVAIGEETEDVIGLSIEGNGRRLLYIPGCAAMTPRLKRRIEGADVLFFDGTTYTDDEMPQLGLSEKTALRMGHMAMSGPAGSISSLADVRVGRRVYVHMNNTNPVLVENGPERASVVAAGWDVAHDGMEIVLEPQRENAP